MAAALQRSVAGVQPFIMSPSEAMSALSLATAPVSIQALKKDRILKGHFRAKKANARKETGLCALWPSTQPHTGQPPGFWSLSTSSVGGRLGQFWLLITLATTSPLQAAASTPSEGINYKSVPAAQGSLSSRETHCSKGEAPFSCSNVKYNKRPGIKGRG